MQRLLLSIAVVSAVALGVVPRALACSCAERPFAELAAEADAIFEGRVASVEPEGDQLRVRLDVVQTWREANAEHVEVRTASMSAACGYPFEVGRSYLVLAAQREGSLVVSLCAGTLPMEDASDQRLSLGSGVIPVDVVDEPPSDEGEGRPPQAVQHRGGGCAGCSAGGSRGTTGILGVLVLALAIVARRFGIR